MAHTYKVILRGDGEIREINVKADRFGRFEGEGVSVPAYGFFISEEGSDVVAEFPFENVMGIIRLMDEQETS